MCFYPLALRDNIVNLSSIVCSLACQNGGMPNPDCTACNCTTDWDGPTCEECTIDNCVTCSGSPAACDECEDGYSVVSGFCGEYSCSCPHVAT